MEEKNRRKKAEYTAQSCASTLSFLHYILSDDRRGWWKEFCNNFLHTRKILEFSSETRAGLLLNAFKEESIRCYRGEDWLCAWPVQRAQVLAPLDTPVFKAKNLNPFTEEKGEKKQEVPQKEVFYSRLVPLPTFETLFELKNNQVFARSKNQNGQEHFNSYWTLAKKGLIQRLATNNYQCLVVSADSQAFYIWKNCYFLVQPTFVIIKYNRCLGQKRKAVVIPDPLHLWNGTTYWGASLQALIALGQQKKYRLIGCDSSQSYLLFCLQTRIEFFHALLKQHPRKYYYMLQNWGRVPSGTKLSRRNKIIYWKTDLTFRAFIHPGFICRIHLGVFLQWRRCILSYYNCQLQTSLQKGVSLFQNNATSFLNWERKQIEEATTILFQEFADERWYALSYSLVANVHIQCFQEFLGKQTNSTSL